MTIKRLIALAVEFIPVVSDESMGLAGDCICKAKYPTYTYQTRNTPP